MARLDPEGVATVVVRKVKAALAGRDADIEALNNRVAQLEARPPGVEWYGTYEHGKAYPRGVLVTRSGSLWLATQDTVRTPGTDPASWKLIVKNGGVAP